MTVFDDLNKSDTAIMNVTIRDVNEPRWLPLSNAHVAEKSPPYIVVQASVSDEDRNEMVRFTLLAWNRRDAPGIWHRERLHPATARNGKFPRIILRGYP